MRFLKTGDTTLQINSLSLGQQEELAEFLRFSYIQETKEQIAGLPIELAKYAWDKAKAKADTIHLGKREHGIHFYTSKGFTYCLHLASNKQISQEQAYAVLDSTDADGREVIAEAAGYHLEANKGPSKDEAIPIKELIHNLVNGPQGYTIEEAKALTLEDIELIYCKPGQPGQVFTQADQQAHLERVAEKKQRKHLGMWGEASIWQQ